MYYIYRITNLINGKTYIGQHKYKKLDDNYMGSGKLIKLAIKKHGIENFKKEILYSRIQYKETADDMERFAIIKERAIGKAEYNISDGGNGGNLGEEVNKKISDAKKGSIPWNKGKKGVQITYWKGKHFTEEHKKSLSASWNYDKHFTEETRKKISKACKGRPGVFKGKHHTEEWKKKMSEDNKERMKEIREAYRKSGRKDWNTFQKEYKRGDK